MAAGVNWNVAGTAAVSGREVRTLARKLRVLRSLSGSTWRPAPRESLDRRLADISDR